MNILIATDKFKDSQTAQEICEGLKIGILRTFPNANCETLPLADGGEGTLGTLQIVLGGEFITCEVQDPLFRIITAKYLWIDSTKTAIVEMARASGIELLKKNERNALITSTFGTGQLILDALENDAQVIILTVGGSATNDGGIGMANALGYVFRDTNKNELKPIGENLLKIHSIDKSKIHPKLANTKFTVATDVLNPFYGENGAAKVFASHRGATDHDLANLTHKQLSNLRPVVDRAIGDGDDANLDLWKGPPHARSRSESRLGNRIRQRLLGTNRSHRQAFGSSIGRV